MAHARTTGQMPEELVQLPLPRGLEHIWQTFCELNRTRSGGMGMGAILFSEIVAWQTLFDIQLTPWEVEMIKKLDEVAIKNSQQEAKPS